MDLQSDLLLGIIGYVSDHQMTDLQHPKSPVGGGCGQLTVFITSTTDLSLCVEMLTSSLPLFPFLFFFSKQ